MNERIKTAFVPRIFVKDIREVSNMRTMASSGEVI